MFRPNLKQRANMTRAMAKAIEEGDLQTVKKLISRNAGDVVFLNATDEYVNTALLKSIRYGKLEIAEYLLTCTGINVNQEAWKDKFEPGETYRCAPLNLAIKKGYTSLVKTMLRFPDINVNNYSFSALSAIDVAILWHQQEIVNLLLCDPRLNMTWLDNLQPNVFTWAYHHLSRASFNALITQPDVKVNSYHSIDFFRSLNISCDQQSSLLCLLTLPDFDVNCRLWEGDNLLMQAVKNDFDALFERTLVRNNLKINAADDKGDTALMWAASLGKTKYVKALLADHHIDAYLQDEQHSTALLFAAKHDHMDIVDLFLSDPNFNWQAKYHGGKNILMLAAEMQLEKLVELILQRDQLDVNARDGAGNTALILAARSHDNHVIATSLLNHGADITLANRESCNAYQVAQAANHQKVKALVKIRPVNQEEYARFLHWKKQYPEAAAQLLPVPNTHKI